MELWHIVLLVIGAITVVPSIIFIIIVAKRIRKEGELCKPHNLCLYCYMYSTSVNYST